jgi:uncharacterized membrane protein YfcA
VTLSFLSAGQWAWMLFAIFVAGFLRGFTGFGFAVVAVPLASLAVPPSLAVMTTLIVQAAIGARDCVLERKRADWSAVWRLVLGSLVGTPVGVLLLRHLPVPWVRLGLGLLVLGAAAVSWRPVRRRERVAKAWGLVAGVFSGVANGLAAMSGPPVIVYFLASETDRVRTRSSMITYFPLAALVALAPSWYAGMVGPAPALGAAIGLPLMILGGWIGAALFRRYGQTAYRPVAIASLAITAAASIARGLGGLLP